MKKQFLIFIIILFVLLFSAQFTLAQGLVPCGGPDQAACTVCDFFGLIYNVVEFVIFTLAPILVVLMITIGGFFILTSRGNPGQFSKGKNIIYWALIGYSVILLAWIIVNTILMFVGAASWVDIGNWWNPTCG